MIGLALPASAQEITRIRGTIERIEGPVYVIKSRDGTELKLTLTDNPLYVAIAPSTMADIKPGMFVGSAGMMQPDGTQKAIEVHIFPESMRGTGEGHYDWDLKPASKMTNGNVEQSVAGVDGPVLSVKYKDGEKKLVVTPETVVVTYVPGNKDEVKPGTKVFVSREKTAGRDLPGPAHHLWQERRRAGILDPAMPAAVDSPNNENKLQPEKKMRSIVSMLLAACAIAAVDSPALAQPAPAPATPPAQPPSGGTPDAIPFDIPYGVSIGLERAKQVMAAAETEAKKRNWKMNIAVVDTNGELVHF